MQHTATHCNTLLHTATHCNTLQHTATHCNARWHTIKTQIKTRGLKHTIVLIEVMNTTFVMEVFDFEKRCFQNQTPPKSLRQYKTSTVEHFFYCRRLRQQKTTTLHFDSTVRVRWHLVFFFFFNQKKTYSSEWPVTVDSQLQKNLSLWY